MAIKTIRSIPTELPHTRLHLDDIEEITQVFSDALRKGSQDEGDPVVSFEVGQLKMDTVADLEAHGGSAANFSIIVSRKYRTLSVTLNSFLEPRCSLYTLNDAEQWRVYGQLKAIFDARGMKLKNAILAIPYWVRVAAWVLLSASPLLPPIAGQKAAPFGTVAIGIMLLTMVILFRPSRAYFVRSRERVKQHTKDVQRWIRDLLLLAVGVALTLFGEWLLSKR